MSQRPRTATVEQGKRRASAQAPLWLAALLSVGCSAQSGASSSRAAQSGNGTNAPMVLVQDTSKPSQSLGAGTSGGTVVLKNDKATGAAGSSAAQRLSEADSCVSTRVEAERVAVDMYIMFDRSGSMTNETGAGPSKWDATREALDNFIQDPRSEGLGVGLQYFPLGKPGVPEMCHTDSECGADNGPCVNRICQPARFGPSIPVTFCASNADCPLLSGGCAPAGSCASDPRLVCFDLGADGCGRGDDCTPLRGECFGYASCEATSYAQPEVAIATLPNNAAALTASLAAAKPLGLTPTYAALGGALQHARAHAMANPTHRVITVLATDGAPQGCDLDDATNVQRLAAQGVSGSPNIWTYVIGVFGPDETEALANLDAWASAGGTGKAFVIDPRQDVSAQFLQALEKIRGGALACEYRIPPSPSGSALDYNAVNVALVSGQQSTDFRYVAAQTRCNLADFGWYYDSDPATGAVPTKISVCEEACRKLQTTSTGRVEVRLGCLTKGPD